MMGRGVINKTDKKARLFMIRAATDNKLLLCVGPAAVWLLLTL